MCTLRCTFYIQYIICFVEHIRDAVWEIEDVDPSTSMDMRLAQGTGGSSTIL